MTIIRIAFASGVLALLAGCAMVPEEEFGSSVRHMIRVQTYNPNATGQAPGADQGLDGSKAESSLEAYRTQKRDGGSAEPMRIMIGQ